MSKDMTTKGEYETYLVKIKREVEKRVRAMEAAPENHYPSGYLFHTFTYLGFTITIGKGGCKKYDITIERTNSWFREYGMFYILDRKHLGEWIIKENN